MVYMTVLCPVIVEFSLYLLRITSSSISFMARVPLVSSLVANAGQLTLKSFVLNDLTSPLCKFEWGC